MDAITRAVYKSKNRDDGKKMIINTDHVDAIYPELYAISFTGEDDPLYIDEKSNR